MNNEQTEIEFHGIEVYQNGRLIWAGLGTYTIHEFNANHVCLTVNDDHKTEHSFNGYGLAIHSF